MELEIVSLILIKHNLLYLFQSFWILYLFLIFSNTEVEDFAEYFCMARGSYGLYPLNIFRGTYCKDTSPRLLINRKLLYVIFMLILAVVKKYEDQLHVLQIH